MGKKVTIYTIAEKLGISAATVSIVLSNRQKECRISKETSDKIRKTAAALGYLPNLAGRRLRSQSGSRQIDLAIITSFEAPLTLIAEWTRRLQETMDKQFNGSIPFTIAIELFHANQLSRMRTLYDPNRYNGVFITNTHPEDDLFLEKTRLPFPAVIVGRQIKNQYCVFEAPNTVGYTAAELFHKAGIKNPAVMYSSKLTMLTKNRLDSFVSQCLQLWQKTPHTILCREYTPEAGAMALKQFLGKVPEIDGLFAVTDILLQGAYRHLHEIGRKIPDDISILGIGDYETKTFFDPKLSTLADTKASIDQAIPLLIQLIKQTSPEQQHLSIIPHPIYRGSIITEK